MKRFTTILAAIAIFGLLFGSFGRANAAPNNFADSAFQTTWTRTDSLVDSGAVKRSFYWGPLPGYTTNEDYAEGVGGKHLVQYFDKSRMEINDPNGDRANPFYVTNGLLTKELISGQMQTGNSRFVARYAAEIDLASDPDDLSAPTYASFRSATYDYGDINKLNQTATATIDRSGRLGSDSRFSSYSVKYTYYEAATRHNIPTVFWDFLNASGPLVQDGKTVNARLNDPYFYATGYPIADAYWASVKIAGQTNTDVLIQPYERRVLTYVPSAPAGFKVQMGNIGQHYYAWRYNDAGKPAPVVQNCPGGRVPVRGFGKVWADHSQVQRQLGCTYEAERAVTTAQQYFEHGQMLDVIYQSGSYSYKKIYVLFEDGSLQVFDDTYTNEAEPTNITAPTGLYVPLRGFGKVWREGTGARVRERLGFATAPETVAALGGQGAGGGAQQYFQRGQMIYAGPVLKKVYVIYNDRDQYSYDNYNHWSVFDDTYQG